MIAKQRIQAHKLRQGMYVVELDRPWLETPFLFQGFLIRNEREVEELCRYCSWVWVDTQRGEKSMPQRPDSDGPADASFSGWLAKWISPWRPRPVDIDTSAPVPGLDKFSRRNYGEQKTTLSEELPRAGESLEQAEEMVRDATRALKLNDTLEHALVRNAVDPIIESVLRNKDAMIWLQSMRGKDEYIFSRSVTCAVWSVIFGRHLGLDRETLSLLATGGLLLDLGKMEIPDELLTRKGKLTDAEMDLVRRHVEHGVALLERSGGYDQQIIEMVRTHHERYNGTGYPAGLHGTDIPALGKIAGIMDTFVAMTSQRPYADAMATYDVMRHLKELADVEFQAELVEQFIQAIGMFPTGSLVELSTGEVAIVTAQNRVRRLRPTVMILLDASKQLLADFKTVDLRESTTDDSGKTSLWISQGLPPGAFGIDPEEFFL